MNNVISNILNNIPERAEVTINYYDSTTINHYNFDSPVRASVFDANPVPPNNTPDLQNEENREGVEEFNVRISRDNVSDTAPFTTQINATIDYQSDLDNIHNVMNLTDALTTSIANSLENINSANPITISTYDMLEKTTLVIYKNIENPEDKCHICNERYNDSDICRKNNLCSHYFHYKCIDHWYTLNAKCPICQQAI